MAMRIQLALLLFAVTAQAQVARVVTDGLVGWWPMENNTTTTPDRASTNTGTLVASPTEVASPLGRALRFNGSSQYVQLPVGSSTKGLTQHSFTCWLYKTNVSTCLVFWESINGSSVTARRNYQVTAAGAILLNGRSADADDSTSYAISATGIFAANRWNFLAFVYDAVTDRHRVYLNGSNVTLTVVAGGTIANTTPATNPQLMAATPNGKFGNGIMDDPRSFSRAISDQEVASLYNSRRTSP
jgi:hypothetical protein